MNKVLNKRDHGIPNGARYIGRGSIAGNPFVLGRDGNMDEVCDKFEAMVEANEEMKKELIAYCKGHNLVCFCSPLRCHGDYLLRISNDEEKE